VRHWPDVRGWTDTGVELARLAHPGDEGGAGAPVTAGPALKW
jgi:hypothetical protein